MEKIFLICVFVLAFYLTAFAEETKIYDSNYNIKYRASENGNIYDSNYNIKYRIRGDGVYDSNYNKVGNIKGGNNARRGGGKGK